jgi:hypothetical protein
LGRHHNHICHIYSNISFLIIHICPWNHSCLSLVKLFRNYCHWINHIHSHIRCYPKHRRFV